MSQNGTDNTSEIARTLGVQKEGKRGGKRFRKVNRSRTDHSRCRNHIGVTHGV